MERWRVSASRLLAWTSLLLIAGVAVGAAAISTDPVPPPAAPLPVRIALSPLSFTPDFPKSPAISQAIQTSEAVKDLLSEHRCLSEVMYFEARSEGETGERAVAEVVFDRLAEGGHGATLCSVIYEGAGKIFCQFTFACDGSMKETKDPEAWRTAQVLAAKLMVGELGQIKDVEGATHYHTTAVHPYWAAKLGKLARIGNHIFYR